MHVMSFFLVLALIVLTALLFVGWLIVVVLRGIARLFLGPGLKTQKRVAQRDPPRTRRCPRQTCKSVNPVEARFCRRCGERMDEPQRVPVRRAAML